MTRSTKIICIILISVIVFFLASTLFLVGINFVAYEKYQSNGELTVIEIEEDIVVEP